MVYDYLITLKKSDYKLPDQVSQLMYFFSLLAFSFFFSQYQKNGLVYLVFIAGIATAWGVTLMKKKKNGQAYFRLGLLIAAAGWIIGPQRNIWMAILYAIAGIIEKQVKFPQEIGFTADGITFNTLPKRNLDWNQVKNIVIKDGLLTIDQKNNKLYQKEIEGYVTADIENEFNEYCLRHMKVQL
jgi:hypothetical protein